MNRAVLGKSLREYAGLGLLLALGIIVLEVSVVRAIVEMSHDLELLRTWLNRPLIQTLLRIALGADLAGDLTPTTLTAIGLGHPLLYALSWALLLTIGSGVIVAEIDRGTADLLLSLPLSRGCIYASTSAAWAVAAVMVSVVPLGGLWLGERVWPAAPHLAYHRLWPAVANLAALNLAVGGFMMFVSSLSSRRGRAIGVVLAVLLLSDLMNFVSQFWEAVRPLSFLGFLHYYRVLPITRSGEWPVRDIAALLSLGVALWLAGLWHFRRRDIRAA